MYTYEDEYTPTFFINKLFNAIYCFCILTACSMVGTYVALLRGRMSRIIEENFGLLNRMYEGLIVLRKDDNLPAFASKPAIKILQNKTLEQLKKDRSPQIGESVAQQHSRSLDAEQTDVSNKQVLCQNDLKRCIFRPTKVSINKAGEIQNKSDSVRAVRGQEDESR